jgi:predicted nucleic acid-binding protein
VTVVFVDTSALIALLDADDHRHAQARRAFEAMTDDRLLTHGYVVAESIAVTRRRFGVDGVNRLIDDLLPVTETVSVSPELHEEALRSYRRSMPSPASFVDQVSFRVIESLEIGTIFALDADFELLGLTVVPGSG